MSEFDAMESMFAGDLIASGPGDVAAVEHEHRISKQKKKFDAVVGRLRTESVETIRGSNVVTEHMDLVRLTISCPPGTIGINDPLAIFRYMTTAANYNRERFVVRTVEAAGTTWTTVEAWRNHLASIERQGS